MSRQTSMNISLPDTLRQWIEERVASEGYGTASEYIRTLLREEQKRRAHIELDRKLLDAIDSGAAAEMTAKDWQRIRATVRQRLSKKTKAKS